MSVSRLPAPVRRAIIIADMGGGAYIVHGGGYAGLWSEPNVGRHEVNSVGEAEMCAAQLSESTGLQIMRMVGWRPSANDDTTILGGAA